MLYVEERTILIDEGSQIVSRFWESEPLAGNGAGLRAAAIVVGCRLSYRDGDHKVSRFSFAVEGYVVPASGGVGPRVGVRYGAILRDDSRFRVSDGSMVHIAGIPATFWERTAVDDRIDDHLIGELRLLILATDDPGISITHGISDGTGMLVTTSMPGAVAPPVDKLVAGGGGVRALFMSGARMEFASGDHSVHHVSASLTSTPEPGGCRVQAKALLKDADLNEVHRGHIFFTLLELPASRFQVAEADVGGPRTGTSPDVAPFPCPVPATPGAIVGVRGFGAEFDGTDHYVRTITLGMSRGVLRAGDAVTGYAGIAHQGHWNAPYRGMIACTTVSGAVAPLTAYTPWQANIRAAARPALASVRRRR